jgi:hypothetical protein
MKRFWLFGGYGLDYAEGGMGDILATYDTLEEALEQIIRKDLSAHYPNKSLGDFGWYQLFDSLDFQVVDVSPKTCIGAGNPIPLGDLVLKKHSVRVRGANNPVG